MKDAELRDFTYKEWMELIDGKSHSDTKKLQGSELDGTNLEANNNLKPFIAEEQEEALL